MTIGESFSGSADPGNLKDYLASVGYSYYCSSHAALLENLYASLDREAWQPAPTSFTGTSALLSCDVMQSEEDGNVIQP